MEHDSHWFLVDDDPDDQDILLMAINRIDSKFQCSLAKDGVEAIEKLSNDDFSPACIFLDLNMPRMNGRECLAEIKKMQRFKETPVFIYSTSSNPTFIKETKELGAAEYIVKPPSIAILAELLQQIHKNPLTFSLSKLEV